MPDIWQTLSAHLRATWGREPTFFVQAPGRVNLLGEHTDYNDGFVLPIAIDRAMRLAIAPSGDARVRLASLDLGQASEFDLAQPIARDPAAPWSDYVRGVATMLLDAGAVLAGFDAVLSGDVPIGAGLSSSAALEVAAARAFQAMSALQFDDVTLARLCQRAESEFVGVNCGIMDQFISLLGRRDHALLIDCRSLDYRQVPLPGDVRVVVIDSGVRRELVSSAYNERRAQCQEGVRRLRQHLPHIQALRDVTPADLARYGSELPPVVRRRCRHVVLEDQRVLDGVAALERGDGVADDVAVLGAALNASHVSLRDDYEVSCPELDVLAEAAWQQPGCLGARMTGAGFGGCTVNLVRADAVDAFVPAVQAAYQVQVGRVPPAFVCQAADGARATPANGTGPNLL
ncbi:MAG: galactokinase [Chloroflexi bacterium]|nr:galactokinase [Chloroflexota bacterium]MBU1747198.1 galactokinase [Chloroflexota bacterium]